MGQSRAPSAEPGDPCVRDVLQARHPEVSEQRTPLAEARDSGIGHLRSYYILESRDVGAMRCDAMECDVPVGPLFSVPVRV